MRYVTAMTLLAVAATSAASSSLPCVCLNLPFILSVDRADAVFRGTVLRREVCPRLDPRYPTSSDIVLCTFRVLDVWKGALADSVVVGTPPSYETCGYGFTAGVTYLVWADSSGARDACNFSYHVTRCSLTSTDDDAAGTIALLQSDPGPSNAKEDRRVAMSKAIINGLDSRALKLRPFLSAIDLLFGPNDVEADRFESHWATATDRDRLTMLRLLANRHEPPPSELLLALRASSDSATSVRAAGVRALSRWCVVSREARRSMRASMGDRAPAVRKAAAGYYASAPPALVDTAIAHGLIDSNPLVRMTALRAAGRRGSQGLYSWSAIAPALQSPSSEERALAIAALSGARIDSVHAAGILRAAVADTSREVCVSVLRLARSPGAIRQASIVAIQESFADSNLARALDFINGVELSALPDDGATLLSAASSSRRAEVRAAAARRIPDGGAADGTLLQLLSDRALEVRIAAVRRGMTLRAPSALAQGAAIEVLIRLDRRDQLRLLARARRLGPAAPILRDGVRRLAESADAEVAAAARRWLTN